MTYSEKIGVIAGGGQFPRLFIDAARDSGKEPIVIGFKGETAEDVVTAVDKYCWVKLGQLGKVINFFKKNNVAEAVFLGTITKTRMFRDVFFDFKGLSLWKRIDKRNDDAILRDIKIGWKVAKEIGRLDIGQCVVVRDRTVLAVESIEGTDATILRGGELGREKVVIVKVHKPGQDFRFDLPATGKKTIETIKRVKGAVLAVEAGKSLLFDAEAVIAAANKNGIVVVGIFEDENGNIRC